MTEFQRRILIVEDDGFMGSLMVGALHNEGFDAVCSPSALDARKKLKSFDPDVVIVDIDLGEGPSGIDFIQMVRTTRPDIAAILLSKHADSQSAGFSPDSIPDGVAYLRKTLVHDTEALVSSIEETVRGHVANLRQDLASQGLLGLLTKSQREILHMMALGLSNQEIANRRNVSTSNVEQRVSEIFRAFGIVGDGKVVPRVEAIRRYIAVSGVPER
jgi:DNA-binding NarL/FixJ family response regulator